MRSCLLTARGDAGPSDGSKTKKIEQAVNFFQKALPLFEATGKRSDEAETLLKIAHEMDKAGEIEQAVQFGRKAKGLYEDLFLPERNEVAAQVNVWETALPQEESAGAAEPVEPAEQA